MQVLGAVALREDARPPSWVRFVPASLADAVDNLSPTLPLPSTLRLVLARRAVAAGEVALAGAHLEHMAPSRDRSELVGELAERRGDAAAAARAFLDAGNLDDVARRAEALLAEGRGTEGLSLERAAIERAESDPSERGNLPEAYYRLGLLEQGEAYRIPDLGARIGPERRSLEAYEQAVVLAPLEERYLVAAGNEEINLGDFDQALAYFARARDANPQSADAMAGFGDVAARRGDVAKARGFLQTARRLDPQAPSVVRLARRLGE